MDKELSKTLVAAQTNEITEYHIYSKLANKIKDQDNSEILQRIANEEKSHADFWKTYTHIEAKPKMGKVFFYYWISRILGITFGIKLMERGEGKANVNYNEIAKRLPEAKKIADDEDRHEKELIGMIQEEKLDYVGSIVLGLNDALVELTGALAGLTFALQNTRIIALAGLITGIAASFSMAASEYLSNKSEGESERALRASVYTGIAYIFTVMALILPYLLIANYFICLALTLTIALLIILFFNYYISVAKDYSFKKRFWEMAILSFGVAAITFGIGYVIRHFFNIDV
ncbi:MAG: VIT1/CCC1 transporter family protein [Bacteroidales bacterium]|nr:VIT1/CCC1 transporter family protein [Bacteroidales bacterium]